MGSLILMFGICILMLMVRGDVSSSLAEGQQKISALYFFGSSFLDVGTNNYLNYTSEANFLPFGETYFHRPTGRNSNGLILSDFLEMKMGFPFLPPYLEPEANFSRGVNFASSGSGVLNVTRLSALGVICLSSQLQQFQQMIQSDNSANKHQKLSESLVIINAGTNDLLMQVLFYPTLPADKVVPTMLAAFQTFVKMLYQTGIRKYLIVGITPLGNQPPRQSNKGIEFLNPMVKKYNAGLKKIVEKSEAEFPGADMIFFDPYDLFVDMINNGSKYGFLETRSCCYVPETFLCEDPSKYMYWNDHPTQEAFRYMADAIWSGDSSVVWPVNLQTFFLSKGRAQSS